MQNKSCPCFSLAEQIVAQKTEKVDQPGLENAQPVVANGIFRKKQAKNCGFSVILPSLFVCLERGKTMRE
ncbi:MAG: hypothetical protein IKW00_04925 [Clostridia bacterium]|nr:hypothetical protein [Clostridia bacterium]